MKDMKNDYDKEKKKKKVTLLISFIIAIVSTLYFHIRLGLGAGGFMEDMGPSWGYNVFLVAIFFTFFFIFFYLLRNASKVKIELTDEEKKRRKETRVDIIFFIIDVIMSGLFVKLNWEQLSSAGTLLAIAEVAAFFAIVWFGFEFFNRFKLFPDRIFKFVFDFFVYVCIPMLFLLIILLGAYQAKYGYDDLFREQIATNSLKFAEVMQDAYYKLITSFYNIGQSNPNLWIWLPIAAFFVMTLWLLYNTFTKKEKTDNEKDAQVLIDESLREQIEEEDYEKGIKKRPLAYNFFKKIGAFMESKKDKEKKEKEKQEEAKNKYHIYDVKLMLKQVKGGTDK